MPNDASPVEGINIDWTKEPAEPGLNLKVHRRHFGQPDNKVATTVANQGEGTVAVPAIAASGTATFSISDTQITVNSRIVLSLQARDTVSDGGTAPAAGNQAGIGLVMGKPGAGSVLVVARNLTAVAVLLTDYVLQYWVTN